MLVQLPLRCRFPGPRRHDPAIRLKTKLHALHENPRLNEDFILSSFTIPNSALQIEQRVADPGARLENLEFSIGKGRGPEEGGIRAFELT